MLVRSVNWPGLFQGIFERGFHAALQFFIGDIQEHIAHSMVAMGAADINVAIVRERQQLIFSYYA
ncbi:hypothetical protein A4R26_09985 [Niastella populi]|uniref:Uncharacterized protein n=1 Tax=Niastella populi TaxID=550983 RepID=A0A1V9EIU6_9BACT|nr:hypothetical protein A4R26_09985 [Niastella populi]